MTDGTRAIKGFNTMTLFPLDRIRKFFEHTVPLRHFALINSFTTLKGSPTETPSEADEPNVTVTVEEEVQVL